MRKEIIIAVFLPLMLFLLTGGSLADQGKGDTITWLILDLPPFFVTKGPDKGRGIADEIQQMVSDRLDGYRSHSRVANASRIARELREDTCVCFAGEFYGNPDFLTSVPTIALLPHAIIVRKEDAHRLGDGKKVSLERLLQHEDLIFGTAKGRLYGPELDPILRKHRGATHIYMRSGKDTLDGLLGMLLKRRVDYLIEYPVSLRYAAKRAGIEDRIAMILIEENAGAPPIRGAIRCPDTEWGRRTIQEINKVLLEIRSSPQYRKIIRDWAVPPGREGEYWQMYQNQILNVRE
ncbi:MAG: TIGR02285 family protein [Deltaproteobacteria bacterium]|nr:TIGR02285 family protein [Deltaproteobacteria bacterium]